MDMIWTKEILVRMLFRTDQLSTEHRDNPLPPNFGLTATNR